MRELCELLENITEEGYTVLFGQYDGSDELYIRISKKGASIVGIVYDESIHAAIRSFDANIETVAED